MTRNRLISYLLAVIIILYGTFGKALWPVFQDLIHHLVPNEELTDKLMGFLGGYKTDEYDKWSLGRYLLYYPIYLFLHLLLVNDVFYHTKHLLTANLVFIGSVLLFATMSVTFLALNAKYPYQLTMKVIRAALNLPLILFIVEGSKILLSDIDRKLQ